MCLSNTLEEGLPRLKVPRNLSQAPEGAQARDPNATDGAARGRFLSGTSGELGTRKENQFTSKKKKRKKEENGHTFSSLLTRGLVYSPPGSQFL